MIKGIFTFLLFCFFAFFAYKVVFTNNITEHEQIVAMRKIGHQTLLKSGDSTSRVLPVKVLPNNIFEIHFEKPFVLIPDSLYNIINAEEFSGILPKNYFVNVYDCKEKKLQYSFRYPLKNGELTPCIGRNFPKNCYYISVVAKPENSFLLYYLLLVVIALYFGWQLKIHRSKVVQKPEIEETTISAIKIGDIEFYPLQQKIIINKICISLTRKESHLLQIFAQNINEEIARERLQKEVWEDEGVIVGRSLDMFISKLRKKLNQQSKVNIVNIHGKGYKLTVE